MEPRDCLNSPTTKYVFLSQIRRYSVSLNDSDRKLVLAMVKKMASNAK